MSQYIAVDPSTWSPYAASVQVIGVDLGLVGDPSAIVAGGFWPQSQSVGITYIERLPLGLPMTAVAEKAANLANKLSADAKLVLDTSNNTAFPELIAGLVGPRPANRILCAAITSAHAHALVPTPLPVTVGGKVMALPRLSLSKRECIETIGVALENKTLRLARVGSWEELREELQKLQRVVRQSGTVSYEAGPGARDDLVLALSLCLFGCRRFVSGGRPSSRRTAPKPPPSPLAWT